MAISWRRGCAAALALLVSTLLLVGLLVAVGLIVGLRQPNKIWVIPTGSGYFAIGRIYSRECRRLQAQGALIDCIDGYGAILYLPYSGSRGYGVEHTLFLIPDSSS
jgi:hypothetical protein